jgi:hypothetical protein
MSAPTSNDADRRASLPKPSPTPEGRIWLRDLPLPPEVVPEIEKECRRRWFWQRTEYRRDLEKECKLQWYFGGHFVAYLTSPEGHAVVGMDYDSPEDFQQIVNPLTDEERDRLVHGYIFPWNDKNGIVLGLTETGVPKPRTATPPVPVPTALPTPEGRVWLRDLPMPAELVPIIDECCSPDWFWQRAKHRRYLENRFKLEWYFGGHYVEYLITPQGYAVVAVDDLSEGGFHRLRDQLPVEERDQLRGEAVSRWNEPRLSSVYQGLYDHPDPTNSENGR